MQAGYSKLTVGTLDVTILSDGTATRDATELLTRIPRRDVEELLARAGKPAMLEIEINAFLVDDGTRKVLVDAGAGDLRGDEAGYLGASLRLAGFDPAGIDDVVVSHIHEDHTGGLLKDGAMLFPNATVHVPERDHALFLDPAGPTRPGEQHRYVCTLAARTIGPYMAAGRVRTYRFGEVIFPWMRSVGAPGNTPGYSQLVLESEKMRLVLLGDTIDIAEVQLPRPEAGVIFDVDGDEAAAHRRRALEAAAAGGYLVGLGHVPLPGVGHVRHRAGGGYAWEPLFFA